MRRVILSIAIGAVLASQAVAQGEKIQLRLRPPAGERIPYRDHFEIWLSIGSRVATAPVLAIDIWRNVTATSRGDSLVYVSIVDSARARGGVEALPPEVDQAAQMMRGTRETTFVTNTGREIRHTVQGTTVDDVFAMLEGGRAPREESYRQWRSLPEDSVREGGEWTDSINMRVDSVEWRGRVTLRLRSIERKGDHYEARVTSSGTLRPFGGGDNVAPIHVSSDIRTDPETGRLLEATIRQDGGVDSRYISVDLRSEWRIRRM